MTRWGASALAAWAAAIACAVVAYLNRHVDASGIEGVYFNRSTGAPAYAETFSGNSFDPFRLSNPYLWLGAAAAFALVGVAILVVARLSRG